MARFIFDFLFLLIHVFLVINMVAGIFLKKNHFFKGIIIDTFKNLKAEVADKEDNLAQFCFICGIEREKIDKAYSNYPDGFL